MISQRRPITLGLLVALSLATVVPRASAVSWLDVGGYIKSFAAAVDEPGCSMPGGATDGDWLWASNHRARVNLGAAYGDRSRVDVSYEIVGRAADHRLLAGETVSFFPGFPVYRAGDLDRRIWPGDLDAGDHVDLLQNLDRCYATLSFTFADLIVGRQAIAWGSARAVNPTDILSIFAYDEIDIEDRRGVDAVRMRAPMGALGELDAGYVTGNDLEWSQSAAFLRGRFYLLQTDAALLAITFRENVLAGVDLARNIGGAGAWLETAYVWVDAANGRTGESDALDYLRLSTGLDYNFNVGNGLYVFAEYHYNGAGVGEPAGYVRNVASNHAAYAEGTVYLLGRHYLIPGLSYQLTPLILVTAQSLVNLNDGSFLAAPAVQYNVRENLYLTFAGFSAVGDTPRMVPAASTVDLELELATEFGTYASQYYIFVQFYY